MKQLALLTLATLLLATVALGQRVAPGVNPGHYQQQPQQQYQPPPPQYNQHAPQQQPPQQHYQQQQPQYQQQQVPVQPQYQQQQAPVQQQQQQQHHQQPPQHGAPQHHGQPQQVLNANNIQQEKAHIAEHMDVPIDTSKMSEQELQFHYFKMHDSDNNNKLDGCELIKSLIHWHDTKEDGDDDHHAEPSATTESHPQDDETLQSLIDPILELMDKDQDGFISYAEYRQAEASESAKNAH